MVITCFFTAKTAKIGVVPPSVAPATAFEYNLSQAEKALAEGKSPRKELGDENIQNFDNSSYDFATFITFALADPAADFGAFARSKSTAVRLLMDGGPPSSPAQYPKK